MSMMSRLPVFLGRVARHPSTKEVGNSFENFFRVLDSEFSSSMGMGKRSEVRELAKAYEVKVELPGFSKEDIRVERLGDQLKISAETGTKDSKKSYEEIFVVPHDGDLSKINAT